MIYIVVNMKKLSKSVYRESEYEKAFAEFKALVRANVWCQFQCREFGKTTLIYEAF